MPLRRTAPVKKAGHSASTIWPVQAGLFLPPRQPVVRYLVNWYFVLPSSSAIVLRTGPEHLFLLLHHSYKYPPYDNLFFICPPPPWWAGAGCTGMERRVERSHILLHLLHLHHPLLHYYSIKTFQCPGNPHGIRLSRNCPLHFVEILLYFVEISLCLRKLFYPSFMWECDHHVEGFHGRYGVFVVRVWKLYVLVFF